MRARRAIPLLAALLVAAVARADPPNEAERALLEPAPAPLLRGRLVAIAERLERGPQPQLAGEAWQLLGRSARRAGLADSAIAAFTRAVAVRHGVDDVLALADARLARGGPGDADSARAAVQALAAGTESGPDRTALRARLALALDALGRSDSALAVWREVEPWAKREPAWTRRLALALARSPVPAERGRATGLLVPLAAATRLHDPEVIRALEAATGIGDRARIEAGVERAIQQARAPDRAAIAALGGTLVDLAGRDGAPLEAAAFPARPGGGRARAAVVIAAPGEPYAASDSLVATLAAEGRAVLVLAPRGSAGSASPAWPGPWSAEGREDAWVDACAADLGPALRALARAFPCDIQRVLLAANGASAPIAARAAAEPGVAALLLTSPVIDEPARAPALDRVRSAGLPVFVQIAPEDFFGSYALADALLHAGRAGPSRVSEGRVPGTGAPQWRDDDAARARLRPWLEDLARAPRATPRPRPRRG